MTLDEWGLKNHRRPEKLGIHAVLFPSTARMPFGLTRHVDQRQCRQDHAKMTWCSYINNSGVFVAEGSSITEEYESRAGLWCMIPVLAGVIKL